MEKITVYIIIGIAWAVITVLRNLKKQQASQQSSTQDKNQRSPMTVKGNKGNTPPPPPSHKISTQNQQSEGRDELQDLLKKLRERRNMESATTMDELVVNEIITTGKEHSHVFHQYTGKKEQKPYTTPPEDDQVRQNHRNRKHLLRNLFRNGKAVRNAMVMNLVLQNPHQS